MHRDGTGVRSSPLRDTASNASVWEGTKDMISSRGESDCRGMGKAARHRMLGVALAFLGCLPQGAEAGPPEPAPRILRVLEGRNGMLHLTASETLRPEDFFYDNYTDSSALTSSVFLYDPTTGCAHLADGPPSRMPGGAYPVPLIGVLQPDKPAFCRMSADYRGTVVDASELRAERRMLSLASVTYGEKSTHRVEIDTRHTPRVFIDHDFVVRPEGRDESKGVGRSVSLLFLCREGSPEERDPRRLPGTLVTITRPGGNMLSARADERGNARIDVESITECAVTASIVDSMGCHPLTFPIALPMSGAVSGLVSYLIPALFSSE